ncbi:hypothetical protein SUGI_0295370 [Cryptomeria japonica]|nr:hypothetical protein SUGI_0295370 [Cryptomeria japonica]
MERARKPPLQNQLRFNGDRRDECKEAAENVESEADLEIDLSSDTEDDRALRPKQNWVVKDDTSSQNLLCLLQKEQFSGSEDHPPVSISKLDQQTAINNASNSFVLPSQAVVEAIENKPREAEAISPDSEREFELFSQDGEIKGDELDNVDLRCISQLTNVLLGRTKGCRGRRSNRQVRENRASEKGIVSVLNFLKKPNTSLGGR